MNIFCCPSGKIAVSLKHEQQLALNLENLFLLAITDLYVVKSMIMWDGLGLCWNGKGDYFFIQNTFTLMYFFLKLKRAYWAIYSQIEFQQLGLLRI